MQREQLTPEVDNNKLTTLNFGLYISKLVDNHFLLFKFIKQNILQVITARHCDMNVFALSLITNECVTSYELDSEANHEEVLDVGRMRQDILRKFVSTLVDKFAQIEPASP